MDPADKLSFSTIFNQQKILINDSQTITVPTSTFNVADTLISVPTGRTEVLTFRSFVEYGGVLYQLNQDVAPIPIIGNLISGIDASFNFFVKCYNLDPPVTNVTFYYRIYTDSAP